MDKIIIGGDTETIDGRPMTMQFYSEDIAIDCIIFCNASNAREKFLKWCSKLPPRFHYVIYFHNLGFDLIELMWGMHERLKESGSEFAFSAGGFDIRGIYGSPTFCALRKGGSLRIDLVDSFSFYRGSLASASALYCPELPKLRHPVGLGTDRFTGTDAAFVEYAMRDAQVTFHIGRAVESLHAEFGVMQCVSVADLAARIFRHAYLTYTIPQPSDTVVYASLDAYHGGKNNLTVEPGWYNGVSSIDISSAYPKAMRDMPAFSRAALYRRFKLHRGSQASRIRDVPAYGVYQISGTVSPCRWPVLFSHSFKPMLGHVDSTWVQGIELNEAIRSGEFKMDSIRGYYYDAEKDIQTPALRSFCDEFYARKQNEKDKVRRAGYKFILNSISGKFIQTRKRNMRAYVDVDRMEVSTAADLVAGGLFHPFIAAAITADTRARIHCLEHKYSAIHTATDGIFTLRKPAKDVTYKNATKLGQLTCDGEGTLLLIRNKCYILYGDKGDTPSWAFEGKRILKAATHGYQGSVSQLEKLIASGKRKYTINKPNKLGESIKRGLIPNQFREREMTLKVGPINVIR